MNYRGKSARALFVRSCTILKKLLALFGRRGIWLVAIHSSSSITKVAPTTAHRICSLFFSGNFCIRSIVFMLLGRVNYKLKMGVLDLFPSFNIMS